MSIQTPLGKFSAANNRRLAYKHWLNVTASESIGKGFHFLRVGEGFGEISRTLEILRDLRLRPAVMSESFSIARLPFSQIRTAAIQTVKKSEEHGSFRSKVCLLCVGTEMIMDGMQFGALMICEDQMPGVVVNVINTSHKVHHKVCIPVTSHLYERWV